MTFLLFVNNQSWCQWGSRWTWFIISLVFTTCIRSIRSISMGLTHTTIVSVQRVFFFDLQAGSQNGCFLLPEEFDSQLTHPSSQRCTPTLRPAYYVGYCHIAEHAEGGVGVKFLCHFAGIFEFPVSF